MANGFRLEGPLKTQLGLMGPQHKRAMVAGANYVAPKALAYMKSNAPWTDRTGNARQGLGVEVVSETNKVTMVLYHSVEYGIFLEVKNGGAYQIIRPTMDWAIPQVIEAIGRLMFE